MYVLSLLAAHSAEAMAFWFLLKKSVHLWSWTDWSPDCSVCSAPLEYSSFASSLPLMYHDEERALALPRQRSTRLLRNTVGVQLRQHPLVSLSEQHLHLGVIPIQLSPQVDDPCDIHLPCHCLSWMLHDGWDVCQQHFVAQDCQVHLIADVWVRVQSPLPFPMPRHFFFCFQQCTAQDPS